MNILIVDDQPSVLVSLTSVIDWASAGIDEVYSASSSLTAKDIIRSKEIHILLTDIEMPIESGLDLIQWIRENGYEIECILITSYMDFAYARQGISLGVVDYVVQPAKTPDILRSVKSAVSKIKHRHDMLRTARVGSFFGNEVNQAVKHFLRIWPEEKETEEFETLLQMKLNRLTELGFHCTKEDSCAFFLTKIQQWNAIPPDKPSLRSTYEEHILRVFSFVNGTAATYFEYDSHLFTLLAMPSYDEIQKYLEILCKQVYENMKCQICIFYCIVPLRSFLSAFRYITGMSYLENAGKYGAVTQVFLTAENKNLSQVSRNYRCYYEQIKAYIRANISLPITRQGISEHIHISPDYISHIVRSVAECSCKELIAGEKMRYAKNLIETTGRSIGDIAVECGYDSFAYFSKVYKSIYGVSPRNARK